MPPLCPIHKVPLSDEHNYRKHEILTDGLPTKDYYPYYHCASCRRAWVVIDGHFYNFNSLHVTWELKFSMSARPRTKGILIGYRVYQP